MPANAAPQPSSSTVFLFLLSAKQYHPTMSNYSAYLGIRIFEDLKWGPHISSISKKANSTLGFICWNLHQFPPACWNTVYLALVRPLLEYSVAVWDPYQKQDINLMECTQHNAAPLHHWRLQVHDPWQCHQTSQENQTTPLWECHQLLCLTLFHRLVVGLVPALPPDKFLTQQKPARLIWAQQQPGYVTTNTIGDYIKNNDRAYIIPCCSTDQLQNSFFIKTTADWNHLDNTSVHTASVQWFKALVAARKQISRPPMYSHYSASVSQTTGC